MTHTRPPPKANHKHLHAFDRSSPYTTIVRTDSYNYPFYPTVYEYFNRMI